MKKIDLKKKIGGIKTMSRKKKILSIVCLILLVLIVVLCARSCAPAEEEYEDMEQMTATAEKMTITSKVSSKGEIKSALEEKKTPHTGYKLEKINVKEGQAVKEGGTILTYTNGQIMTAPYDCVVISWNLPKLKNTLNNDHYVDIAGTKVLMMELDVKEDKIFLVKKGNPATIKVNATDGRYEGVVSFVSDVGDYADGMSTFKVNVIFDNDGKLKLGMNGRAKVILEKAENVIGVPVDAVYDDGENSFVTVMKDGGEEEVQVETGIQNNDYIEIKDGLKAGDEVVYSSYDDSEWDDEYY
ncbi:MAG: HlyD family efflux transporter periplasmic adaptor subunit [Bacillota bacterium]|nr:HlyD family efflux transporter periplasmic adaptor subunit [Bacillota bacterium]